MFWYLSYIDNDECADKRIHGCHRRADCINMPGRYECRCRGPHYIGNGFKCDGEFVCVLYHVELIIIYRNNNVVNLCIIRE